MRASVGLVLLLSQLTTQNMSAATCLTCPVGETKNSAAHPICGVAAIFFPVQLKQFSSPSLSNVCEHA